MPQQSVTGHNSITLSLQHCLHGQKEQSLRKGQAGPPPLLPLHSSGGGGSKYPDTSKAFSCFVIALCSFLLSLSFLGKKSSIPSLVLCPECAKIQIIFACLYEKPWRRDYWCLCSKQIILMEVIKNELMCSEFVPFPSPQEQIKQISDCFRFKISNLHYFQNCCER